MKLGLFSSCFGNCSKNVAKTFEQEQRLFKPLDDYVEHLDSHVPYSTISCNMAMISFFGKALIFPSLFGINCITSCLKNTEEQNNTQTSLKPNK